MAEMAQRFQRKDSRDVVSGVGSRATHDGMARYFFGSPKVAHHCFTPCTSCSPPPWPCWARLEASRFRHVRAPFADLVRQSGRSSVVCCDRAAIVSDGALHSAIVRFPLIARGVDGLWAQSFHTSPLLHYRHLIGGAAGQFGDGGRHREGFGVTCLNQGDFWTINCAAILN